MVMRKIALPRRTFIRGMGATLALPLLDAMVPAMTAVSRAAPRFAAVYVGNGANMNDWTPQTDGVGFAFSPLSRFRDLNPDELRHRGRSDMGFLGWSATIAAIAIAPSESHCTGVAAKERVARESGVNASVAEPTRTSSCRRGSFILPRLFACSRCRGTPTETPPAVRAGSRRRS